MLERFFKAYQAPTIYGHGIFALVINIGLAAAAPVNVASFLRPSPDSSLKIYFGIVAVLCFAMPSYALYELKHVITDDGIANDKTIGAKLLFGFISILGLVTASLTNLVVTNHFQLAFPQIFFAIVGLSLVSAYGGALGLLDQVFPLGFYPPLLIKSSLKILSNHRLLILGTTILHTASSFFIRFLLLLFG